MRLLGYFEPEGCVSDVLSGKAGAQKLKAYEVVLVAMPLWQLHSQPQGFYKSKPPENVGKKKLQSLVQRAVCDSRSCSPLLSRSVVRRCSSPGISAAKGRGWGVEPQL